MKANGSTVTISKTHLMSDSVAHILVTGFVQGVGFRYFVRHHAERLGLHGFTRNLPGGEVEIQAEGDRDRIEQLIMQVRRGPRSANVFDVQVEWKHYIQHFSDFEIK